MISLAILNNQTTSVLAGDYVKKYIIIQALIV